MAKRDDYDWLEDPFDDKKIEEESQTPKMSGISCALIALAVIVIFLIIGALSFSACSVLTLGSGLGI